jgi:arylsulfatase A-like enzyme
MPYDDSRGWFRGEADFPGPRVMQEARRWLREEADPRERFLLFVDEFDPHEPFDTPEPYASMYDESWEGPEHLVWPPYTVGAIEKGVLTEREGRQVRAQYGGKLTMIDAWFGGVLDELEQSGRFDDTVVIVCTDHGHFLGEKDIYGKPGCPLYEPIGHTPLLIAWPGVAGGTTCDALTTNVDLHATLCDIFGVAPEHRTHGRSLVPLLTGDATSVREWALAGIWGREVHLVADHAKYVRAPAGANEPLSMWSNRWSTMPVHGFDLKLPRPDERATLDHMPGSSVPVIRQPFTATDPLPFWAYAQFGGNRAFDLGEDPAEDVNRADDSLGMELADALREALREVEAPADQLQRLGF